MSSTEAMPPVSRPDIRKTMGEIFLGQPHIPVDAEPAPTLATTPPERAQSFTEKISAFIIFGIMATCIFSSIVFAIFSTVALQLVVLGLFLTILWDSIVQNTRPALDAIPSMFWHYLRAELIGSFIVSSIGGILFVCVFAWVIGVRPGTLAQDKERIERRVREATASIQAIQTNMTSSMLLKSLQIVIYGTLAMLNGITTLLWWNDGKSIDAETEDIRHCLILAAVGSLAYAILSWSRNKGSRTQDTQQESSGQLAPLLTQEPQAGADTLV